MKNGHTFTFSSKDPSPFGVEITLPEDASLEEVLRAFETYLRSAGFYIEMDDFLVIESGADFDINFEPDFTSEKNLDEVFRQVDETLDRIAKKTSNVISFTKKSEEKKNEDR